MRVEEESAQLLAEEVRRLSREVAALAARVEMLEGSGVAAPVTEQEEEREGDFGPAVKRSTSDQHRNAVQRALSMLGVIPYQEVSQASRKAMTASVKRALHKAKTLGGEGQEIHAASASDEVPLPELHDNRPEGEGFLEADAAPVELGNAIPIDLARGSRGVAGNAILLLAGSAAVVALTTRLPGAWGVLASLPLVALLAAPWWGYMRPMFSAHARFLGLIVMSRCLFPDFLQADAGEPWLNLRFFTMLAACLPAFVLVMRGAHGWAVQALVMGAVLGCAVGAEMGSWVVALCVAGIALGGAITLRSLPARGA